MPPTVAEPRIGFWVALFLGVVSIVLVVQACAVSNPGPFARSEESNSMPPSTSASAKHADAAAGVPGATSPEPLNVPPIDAVQPRSTETAVFALGCFWGSDALYGSIPGVLHTRVGYCGGSTENPTYHAISDYTESVQVEFDPSVVSYDQLLTAFWANCDPEAHPWSRQYRSVAFYDGADQQKIALASRDRLAKLRGITVQTEVLPVTTFYNAEGYHQKYQLQNNKKLMQEFTRYYPNLTEFANSTAAARINGYLDGFGSVEQYQKEKASYGLTPEGEKALTSIINSHPPRSCGLGN